MTDATQRLIKAAQAAVEMLRVDGTSYIANQLEAALAAVRQEAAPAAQGVPDGWTLVPIEPTQEMILAMCKLWPMRPYLKRKVSAGEYARCDWLNALAAARNHRRRRNDACRAD